MFSVRYYAPHADQFSLEKVPIYPCRGYQENFKRPSQGRFY